MKAHKFVVLLAGFTIVTLASAVLMVAALFLNRAWWLVAASAGFYWAWCMSEALDAVRVNR